MTPCLNFAKLVPILSEVLIEPGLDLENRKSKILKSSAPVKLNQPKLLYGENLERKRRRTWDRWTKKVMVVEIPPIILRLL